MTEIDRRKFIGVGAATVAGLAFSPGRALAQSEAVPELAATTNTYVGLLDQASFPLLTKDSNKMSRVLNGKIPNLPEEGKKRAHDVVKVLSKASKRLELDGRPPAEAIERLNAALRAEVADGVRPIEDDGLVVAMAVAMNAMLDPASNVDVSVVAVGGLGGPMPPLPPEPPQNA